MIRERETERVVDDGEEWRREIRLSQMTLSSCKLLIVSQGTTATTAIKRQLYALL